MSGILRFRVEKLIRDRAPELMRSWGLRLRERRLDDTELAACLRAKLQEEAAEVASASTREALLEELADVSEVLLTLCAVNGIAASELEACRVAKRRERGGFDARIYSAEVEADAGSAAAEYYLQRPAQYPRIATQDEDG